jgi:hypothetical protein
MTTTKKEANLPVAAARERFLSAAESDFDNYNALALAGRLKARVIARVAVKVSKVHGSAPTY